MFAALADREASRSYPREGRFIGAVSKTAFCHGIFFRYRYVGVYEFCFNVKVSWDKTFKVEMLYRWL